MTERRWASTNDSHTSAASAAGRARARAFQRSGADCQRGPRGRGRGPRFPHRAAGGPAAAGRRSGRTRPPRRSSRRHLRRSHGAVAGDGCRAARGPIDLARRTRVALDSTTAARERARAAWIEAGQDARSRTRSTSAHTTWPARWARSRSHSRRNSGSTRSAGSARRREFLASADAELRSSMPDEPSCRCSRRLSARASPSRACERMDGPSRRVASPRHALASRRRKRRRHAGSRSSTAVHVAAAGRALTRASAELDGLRAAIPRPRRRAGRTPRRRSALPRLRVL